MGSIVVFSLEERDVVDTVLLALEERNPRKIPLIKNQMEALFDIGRGISRYPSVVGTQSLDTSTRSLSTLIDRLCGWADDAQLISLPTKAVLGRAFLIGKINFFSMLLFLCRKGGDLDPLPEVLVRLLSLNVFTLMSEEVYVSILEDSGTGLDIKRRAGKELAHVWESRLDKNVGDYAPLLASLWHSRRTLRPVFGSMMGMSELYTLSMGSDPLWLNCLLERKDDQGFIGALEEFLFNLTYEEIGLIRGLLEKREIKSIGQEEVESILGSREYSDVDESDPREMYRFFMQRKNRVTLRRRAQDKAGPRRTLEEYVMLYLMDGTQ